MKPFSEWMAERGLTEAQLVEAIAQARYTPSPEQRRCLAAVLNVSVDDIAWAHITQISHIYGHGPQFGRSP